MRSDGVTPIDGIPDSPWLLSATYRATVDDSANGDMTQVDFPVVLRFSDASSGKMSARDDTNHLLTDLGLSSLPACTQLEFLDVRIIDPSGNVFAKPGVGSR